MLPDFFCVLALLDIPAAAHGPQERPVTQVPRRHLEITLWLTPRRFGGGRSKASTPHQVWAVPATTSRKRNAHDVLQRILGIA